MIHKFKNLITGDTAEMSVDTDGTAHLVAYDHGQMFIDRTYQTEGIAMGILHRHYGMWVPIRMSDDEALIVKNKIFRFVRDYSTSAYSLPRVFSELLYVLRAQGYEVSVTDDTHRNFKEFSVDGRSFRLFRRKGWTTYDVC